MLNDIYWIKFGDDGDIACMCISGRKKCPPEKKATCREYVTKFSEIHRDVTVDRDVVNDMNRQLTELEKTLKKWQRRF